MKIIYTIVPCKEQADYIARSLINSKHAACVNILESARSLYIWEGEIMSEMEVVMIIKTSSQKSDLAMKKIRELHPYKIPCIITFEDIKSNEAFEEWVYEAMSG